MPQTFFALIVLCPLVMEDASVLAGRIGEAMQVLHDPQTSADARRSANEFVLQVQVSRPYRGHVIIDKRRMRLLTSTR